jgi:YidC/Oxa1 family membrane protein insertase
MDKNTLIAVVLSVIVITAGFMIQTALFPPAEPVPQAQETVQTLEPAPQGTEQPAAEVSTGSSTAKPVALQEGNIPLQTIKAETELYEIEFSNRGGIITSLKLKDHSDGDHLLQMVLGGDENNGAFDLLLGGPNASPITENFNFRRVDNYTFEFYRTFLASDEVPFEIIKTYVFKPDEYMMELKITIANSRNAAPAINNGGYAYTLRYGPQIGPNFVKLDGRYAYRKYYTFSEKKAQEVKVKDGFTPVSGRVSWAAMAGKYFTVIGIPDATPYDIGFSNNEVPGVGEGSQLYFSRPVIKNVNKSEDIFRFYLGPKNDKSLAVYNDPRDNDFRMGNMELDQVVDTSSILGWLEFLLSKLLMIFYSLIPNYGVAIILVTVVIKVIFFPFTRKSSESTAKMSALSPQMDELKKKYKDKPEQLNKAMAELYKKEGVNPMGGCLPLIIQMPFFFAMYGLFNKYFEFRGAVFIPGWITDLSAPEAIFTFSNFTIPILGWDAIRLLPMLFVLTQLLYTKLMQPSSGQANSQMKMMNTMMPIMFFFILYNAPSGLLLYWIASNVITGLQQLVTNKMKKKKASA